MKLYTKVGDKGETGLFGGEIVRKDHPRVVAYGEIDETNAAMGLAVEAVGDESIADRLRAVQSDLFTLGAILATPKPSRHTPVLTDEMIKRLEGWIDEADGEAPELTSFILPGGCESSARLHLARTICRRAERTVAGVLVHPCGEGIDGRVLIYLNRVSDWLFALARLVNHRRCVKDIIWKPGASQLPV